MKLQKMFCLVALLSAVSMFAMEQGKESNPAENKAAQAGDGALPKERWCGTCPPHSKAGDGALPKELWCGTCPPHSNPPSQQEQGQPQQQQSVLETDKQ